MGSAENRTPRTVGKEEMRELLRATFGALEGADLTNAIAEIRERVFQRSPDDLLETSVDNGVCTWRFKPMVELLLHHVLDLALRTDVPARDREIEIGAAIELAGF